MVLMFDVRLSKLKGILVTEQFVTLDVLKHLQETAVEAAKLDVSLRTHVIDLASFGISDRVLLVDKDGDAEPMCKSQPRRTNVLLSCADVVEYAKFCVSVLSQAPIIWISPEAIIVQDDADRLTGDYAKYTLRKTDLWNVVSGIGKSNGGKYSQPDLRRLLRVQLLRAFSDDQKRRDLLENIKTLKLSATQSVLSGKGTHEVGIANCTSADIAWPENLMLKTTVFEDASFNNATWPVEVSFDVRPEEAASHPFQLEAIPADLAAAERAALEFASDLIRKLAGDDIPVFLGSPSRRGD